jgi:hypothetical protein
MPGITRISAKVGGGQRTLDDMISRHVEHKVAEIREREANAKRAPAAE